MSNHLVRNLQLKLFLPHVVPHKYTNEGHRSACIALDPPPPRGFVHCILASSLQTTLKFQYVARNVVLYLLLSQLNRFINPTLTFL